MFAPPLIATSVRPVHASRATNLLDARDRERAGRLRDGARVLEDVLDGGADLVGGHEQDLVDVLLGEAKGFLADAPHGDAVGENADARQRHALAGAQRFEHAGRILRLDADDLDARIERLHVRGDAADQSSAADRDEDRLDAVAVPLAQDLHGDRALAGDDVGIVERVHEHEIAVAREADRMLVRRLVVIAMQHDLGRPDRRPPAP